MSFERVFRGERPVDFQPYQRTYPDRVRSYFRGTGKSAIPIAQEYGVSERTALNWPAGSLGASGPVIVRIAFDDPQGFQRHFGVAA